MAVSEHQLRMVVNLARQWASENPRPTTEALAARLQRYGQAQGLPRPASHNPWPLEIAEYALAETPIFNEVKAGGQTSTAADPATL